MPRDMGILVEISNGICSRLGRRLDFMHMPVPKDRTDSAYFRPLARLEPFRKLPSLILGLIHYDDAAGDEYRIAAAREFVPMFGVASECGWGRTDPAASAGVACQPPAGR